MHLFDVDPGVETTAFGSQNNNSRGRVTTRSGQFIGELEPLSDRQSVYRRTVDDNLDDSVVMTLLCDAHDAKRI